MNGHHRLRIAVLISGGGTNLQALIDHIDAGSMPADIVGVISDRPGAYGLQRAARAGLSHHCVDYQSFGERTDFDRALADKLGGLQAELIVLAGYMRILSATTVQQYAGRMLNIHPSLLPAYPGLHTYARALAAGEQWHGSTVHFVIPELDAGPAVIRYRVRIRPGETEPELQQRVQQGEHIIYPRAIGWYAADRLCCKQGQVWLDGRQLREPETVDEVMGINQ